MYEELPHQKNMGAYTRWNTNVNATLPYLIAQSVELNTYQRQEPPYYPSFFVIFPEHYV